MDLYLFHVILYLNPVFNCSESFLSFSADKITTGTHNLVSVILKVAPVGLLISATAGLPPWASTALLYVLLVNTQFSDQVKIKETSQFTNGIFKLF